MAWIGPVTALLSVLASLPALACDEQIGRSIARGLSPAIQALGCGERGGLRAEHRLDPVCYTEAGDGARIEVTARLRCVAGMFPPIEAVATAVAEVAADCRVASVETAGEGELGQVFAAAFEAGGPARPALQDAVDAVCGD